MRKLVIFISTILFFVVFTAGVIGYLLYGPNSESTFHRQKVVVIKKGMNVNAISRLLQTKGVISHTGSFILAAKILGIANDLKAGRYDFKDIKNNITILRAIHAGKVSSIRVTLPEGLPAKKIVSILSKKLAVDSVKLMRYINDSAFVHSLQVPAPSLEGFLFPETYDFFWQQDEADILKKQVAYFFKIVNDSLQMKMKEEGLTLLQAVTLASLIQGEAMVEDEMPLISAVYHNRLQNKMLLQADPTLQYIISDGPRRLTNADKRIDSPYNTYRYPGLPPGPINNPGIAAIKAALYPANLPYLYFVATGDGTHAFSRTLQEHLRAKQQFDRLRRNYYRKLKLEKGNH